MASQRAHQFLLDWVSDHVPAVPDKQRPELAKALAEQCLAEAPVHDLSEEEVKEAAGFDLVGLMRDALDAARNKPT